MRRLSYFYSAILLLLLISISISPIHLHAQSNSFPWPEGKKAALSLSFDDARLSHPELGKDLFRRLEAKATFYVVPSGMKNHLKAWKEIVADGHEIGNHTIYHPCTGNFDWAKDKALENYNLNTMRQELLSANHQIREMLGVTPISFAYTCGNTFVGRGQHTQSYVPLIAELFQNGRGWLNEASNDPSFADLALLQGIEMDGKDFETDIKPLVDAAVKKGSWLLLAGHEIGEGGSQTTRVAMLEKLIAYVKRPESGIWMAPVGTIAQYVEKQRKAQVKNLAASLRFCATFDQGYTADYAKGDSRIFSAPRYPQHNLATPNRVPEELGIAQNRGRFGHALEFKRKAKPMVFYAAEDNINYQKSNWRGTVSMWLSLDPEKDLAPGFTDPIQITDTRYDDAAIWVDFTDKNPRDFRMGVYGDVKVWNPNKLDWKENPKYLKRLVPAMDKPFARGTWTHVAVSYSGLNGKEGQASFYINGKLQGSRSITEPFTWDLEQARIMLGLNFIGLMDEVAIFDKTFSAEEIITLYQLPEGIHSLLSP